MTAPISDTTALAFCSLNVCLALIPGPDMLCIVSNAVVNGRAAGWMTCLGIAVANMFYAVCIASGFSAVLATLPAAYEAIRIAGAIYLAWIGLRMVRHPLQWMDREAPPGWKSPFVQGVVTSLLNPKIALFAAVVIPQFVDARRESPLQQIIALSALWILSGMAVNLLGGTLAAAAQGLIRAWPRRFETIQRSAGVALLGLAARVALDRSHA